MGLAALQVKMLLMHTSDSVGLCASTEYFSSFVVVKPKTVATLYDSYIATPQLLPFFIACGKHQTLHSTASVILRGLIFGLCYVGHDTDFDSIERSDCRDFSFISNAIRYNATNLDTLNRNFSNLRLGVIIKYTKLSRQVRKNLRGKQRYKAYLTLPQDTKIRGCVFRLYKLYSLASSDTRPYESYSNVTLFLSELFFHEFGYEMVYAQIQKLMLQSYVDSGSRAVVPTITP